MQSSKRNLFQTQNKKLFKKIFKNKPFLINFLEICRDFYLVQYFSFVLFIRMNVLGRGNFRLQHHLPKL